MIKRLGEMLEYQRCIPLNWGVVLGRQSGFQGTPGLGNEVGAEGLGLSKGHDWGVSHPAPSCPSDHLGVYPEARLGLQQSEPHLPPLEPG